MYGIQWRRGGPYENRVVSIDTLICEVLEPRSAYSYRQLWPEDDKFGSYLVKGAPFGEITISDYSKEHISKFTPENIKWQQMIGSFRVEGVIRGKTSFLAFSYTAKDKLGMPDIDTRKELEDSTVLRAHIRAEIDEKFAEYLHIKSMLQAEDIKITLDGRIRNTKPRLFIANGINIQSKEFAYAHGWIHEPHIDNLNR